MWKKLKEFFFGPSRYLSPDRILAETNKSSVSDPWDDPLYDPLRVNPANGLPMIPGTHFDIAGNFYGSDENLSVFDDDL